MKFKDYNIITLCGSTRFKEEFEQVQRELTLKGNIVLSVGLFSHAEENGDDWASNGIKEMLDDLHKRKIDMASYVVIINKDGYIGKSTMSEVYYSMAHDKIIYFLEDPSDELKRDFLDYNVRWYLYENNSLMNDKILKGD